MEAIGQRATGDLVHWRYVCHATLMFRQALRARVCARRGASSHTWMRPARNVAWDSQSHTVPLTSLGTTVQSHAISRPSALQCTPGVSAARVIATMCHPTSGTVLQILVGTKEHEIVVAEVRLTHVISWTSVDGMLVLNVLLADSAKGRGGASGDSKEELVNLHDEQGTRWRRTKLHLIMAESALAAKLLSKYSSLHLSIAQKKERQQAARDKHAKESALRAAQLVAQKRANRGSISGNRWGSGGDDGTPSKGGSGRELFKEEFQRTLMKTGSGRLQEEARQTMTDAPPTHRRASVTRDSTVHSLSSPGTPATEHAPVLLSSVSAEAAANSPVLPLPLQFV